MLILQRVIPIAYGPTMVSFTELAIIKCSEHVIYGVTAGLYIIHCILKYFVAPKVTVAVFSFGHFAGTYVRSLP